MSDEWEWVQLRPGAKWPQGSAGRALLRRLDKVGRHLRRPITITSGKRNAQEQWFAYMDYLQGGTLAAPCCTKNYTHKWSECRRECASNHCRSRAADCVVTMADGRTFNIGEIHRARQKMKAVGLCLPVGAGETWHVEVGNTWRS